jgi:restriction endonuclease Mrr
MIKVQVTSQVTIDLEKVLESVDQLDVSELETFAFQVNTALARRKAPNLPVRETELLQKINEGVSDGVYTRLEELSAKLDAEVLTAEEHQELLSLVELVEQVDAERMGYLTELAQIRGVPLDDLMKKLGLYPLTHV